MVEFTLWGRVLPKWLSTLSFVAPFTVGHVGGDAGDGTREYTISIDDGAISVRAKVSYAENLTPALLGYAYIEACELIGGLLGGLAFASGLPYASVFDEVEIDGQRQDLMLTNPELAQIATALTVEDNVPALHILMADPRLIQIFGDLNLAIARTQYQPIACGRVIDGIRNYLAPWSAEKGKQKQGFEEVANLLNFDYAYGRSITEAAIKPRHREAHEFEDGEVAVIIRRTWHITNRFLEYLKRGRTPLTAPEFPLLSAPP